MEIDPTTIKLIAGGLSLGFAALWAEVVRSARRCEKDRTAISRRLDHLERKMHACPYPCNLRDTKEPTEHIKLLPRLYSPPRPE